MSSSALLIGLDVERPTATVVATRRVKAPDDEIEFTVSCSKPVAHLRVVLVDEFRGLRIPVGASGLSGTIPTTVLLAGPVVVMAHVVDEAGHQVVARTEVLVGRDEPGYVVRCRMDAGYVVRIERSRT